MACNGTISLNGDPGEFVHFRAAIEFTIQSGGGERTAAESFFKSSTQLTRLMSRREYKRAAARI